MLKTSVSLPLEFAVLWKFNQKKIMKSAIRILRIHLRQGKVRRGVTRRYNHEFGEFSIITTRFTAAEYDALHFVAASLRVSVSWLIYTLIQLWRKEIRRSQHTKFIANYDLNLCIWHPKAGVCTESLLFWPKAQFDLDSTSRLHMPILR